MTNRSNSSGVFGNTKQIPPAKNWCFTLNNWTEKEYTDILNIICSDSSSNKYVIGKEVGKSGTPHLQGFVIFFEKCRPFGKFNCDRIHWEKCKGNALQNYIYCSKDGDFITNMKCPRAVKCLDEDQLRDWQLEIVKIIENEPDDRKIYWYWEPKGNMGKTTFCKYLSIKHHAIPVEGKKNDILYCCAEHESDIYVFDFERSMEEYISYAAMEKIKNGYYMCSKYESKPIIRNCPHIFCFANFKPDTNKLSADRWVIKRIR